MPFIERLIKNRSVCIIGLEKNVGKTETLNYILNRLKNSNLKIGITSIGIDGELLDQVTGTAKPEIEIVEGMYFATSEKHYKDKNFWAEVLDVTDETTPLGRVVIGKALNDGKILLSGPVSSYLIKKIIDKFSMKGVDLTLVDGALNRLSVGAPVITDGIVLATGGAVSLDIKEIIKKTAYTIELLNIEKVDENFKKKIVGAEGIYKINLLDGIIEKLEIKSILFFHQIKENIFKNGDGIYTSGAITDRFIEMVIKQEWIRGFTVVVTDFTKIFVSKENLNRYRRAGGEIKVLDKTNLLAITVNPTSPTGRLLSSEEIIGELKKYTDVPVVDIRLLKR